MPYRQSVYEALAILNGDWTIAVLATLASGERRFGELLSEINEVEERTGWVSHDKPLSKKVLTETLKRMQGHSLIERRAEGGTWGGVWYRLTPAGRGLLRASRTLVDWAREYREQPPSPQSLPPNQVGG